MIYGYVEIPKGYWTMTTTIDMDNPNLYWHDGEND